LSVEVTYIYGCNPDQGRPFLNTTVTQESTHSLARIDYTTQGQCTGEIRTLAINLTVQDTVAIYLR